MIVTTHRDLLSADAEALVNPVNTVGVMGRGLALQFKRTHPANYRAYRDACAAGQVRLGEMLIFDSGKPGRGRYVINFPTKGHWRNQARLDDIRRGVDSLVDTVIGHRIGSIAVPALGCGLGGLEWSDVRPVIECAFAPLPDVRVLLFPPQADRAGTAQTDRAH
ncbi:macro domain-containing protein [Micromonospora echinofusca]|uniref:Macro domain-containing protein n=1 Tax=Micromonospora echinofusca TaxID=47858 RepID=A0ABS3VUW7_MICEH|nr:macro domain-containing protein [Micromonospora echinofusca]MBO4208345.1 hypothetical protein [Micromonospora echinofusca]